MKLKKIQKLTFEITSVTYTTETAIEIAGNLTVKGTTIPMKFPAYVRNADGNKFFAQAFFTIDSRLLPIATKYTVPEVAISIHLFATK
ncbi:MAG: YceI family protein [Chitinophagaceae bacterium]